MNMKKNLETVSAAALLAVVCGCGGSEQAYRPSLVNPDKSNPPAVGATKSMEQMAKDDIVVWVDGSAMTRQDFDNALGFVNMRMRRAPSNLNPQQLMSIYQKQCFSIIPDFVSVQLLVHEARNRKLLSEEELVRRFEEQKDILAKQCRASIETVAKTFPGGMPAIDRMAETRVWQLEMVDKIQPIAIVDAPGVSNFLEIVRQNNLATATTNAMRKARLEAMRKDILAGKATFEDLAEKHSQCHFKAPGSGGRWGSYRRNFFNKRAGNDEMGQAIFNLKEGEISEVLEDGQGYSIVKFVKYDDRFGDTDGEDRLLARIFLKKDPPLVTETFDSMKELLTRQMKDQGVEKELNRLKSEAVIVYPHGTNFFPNAMQMIKRGGK